MIDNTTTFHEVVVRYSSGHPLAGASFGDAHVEASLVWETVELLQALAATIDPLDPNVPDDETMVALFHLKAATNRIAAQLGDAAAAHIAREDGAQCREAVEWMDNG